VDQLDEFNGCCVLTAEIIWKYYRALMASHSKMHWRELNKTKAATLAAITDGSHVENDNSVDSASLLSMIWAKLTDENIDSFVDLVEGIYKQSFEPQYKDFSVVNNYFVERKHVKTMYQS
jgi:hypothetical protein